jgi:hypothetical protein
MLGFQLVAAARANIIARCSIPGATMPRIALLPSAPRGHSAPSLHLSDLTTSSGVLPHLAPLFTPAFLRLSRIKLTV